VHEKTRPVVGDHGPKGSGKQEPDPFSKIATWKQGDRRDPVTVINGVILSFPERGPWKVELLREGPAFLVRARDHGWLHGSLADALADAQWLAANGSVAIVTDLPEAR